MGFLPVPSPRRPYPTGLQYVPSLLRCQLQVCLLPLFHRLSAPVGLGCSPMVFCKSPAHAPRWGFLLLHPTYDSRGFLLPFTRLSISEKQLLAASLKTLHHTLFKLKTLLELQRECVLDVLILPLCFPSHTDVPTAPQRHTRACPPPPASGPPSPSIFPALLAFTNSWNRSAFL